MPDTCFILVYSDTPKFGGPFDSPAYSFIAVIAIAVVASCYFAKCNHWGSGFRRKWVREIYQYNITVVHYSKFKINWILFMYFLISDTY